MTLVEPQLSDAERAGLARELARQKRLLQVEHFETTLAEAILRELTDVMEQVANSIERQNHVVVASAEDGLSIIPTLWTDAVGKLQSTLQATFDSGVEVASGSLSATQIGIDSAVIDPVVNEAALTAISTASNRIVGVSDSVWDSARASLRESMQAGDSIPTAAAKLKMIPETYAKRAMTVARTEVVGLTNAGSFAYASSLGDYAPVGKQWLAADDERTRPSHAEADGQKVGMKDSFIVGSSPCQYPGDPSLPAGEVINCRCTITWIDDPAELDGGAASTAAPTTPVVDEAPISQAMLDDPAYQKLLTEKFEPKKAAKEAKKVASIKKGATKQAAGKYRVLKDGDVDAATAWDDKFGADQLRKLKLTSGEEDALFTYTKGSTHLNTTLRDLGEKHGVLSQESATRLGEVFKMHLESLDSIFKRFKLQDAVTVTRGLDSSAITELANAGKLVGQTITDAGFMSTSTIASFSGSVAMHLNVPKGSHAIPIDSLSNIPGEFEVLIDRGSSFKVTKVESVSDRIWSNRLHLEIWADLVQP